MRNLIYKLIKLDLSNLNLLEKEYYIFCISIFDHFLTENEYINADLVSYNDAKKSVRKKMLFNKIENKFIFIYTYLFKISKANVIAIIDNKPIRIKSFNNYMYLLDNVLKEKKLYIFIYPLLGCFTITGYDLTHQFFVKKNKFILKKQIEILANKTKLNIIKI